jgi:hemerythrin
MVLFTITKVQYISVDEMQHIHKEEISMLNKIDELALIYENDKTKHTVQESKLDAYIQHVKDHFVNEERLIRFLLIGYISQSITEYCMNLMAL